MWNAVVDVLFPAQCAGCNVLGTGLCEVCAPLRRQRAVEIGLAGLRVRAYGEYSGTLRAAVLALKDGRRDVAGALGMRVAPLVDAGATLVPVPTTAKRRRVRGIDGVLLVARAAAGLRGARVVAALSQRAGDAQRGRTRGERLAARGRFTCDPQQVAGTTVVLLDDVCTTGATLEDCAWAVREAGGRVERAVVVAVTNDGAAWNR